MFPVTSNHIGKTGPQKIILDDDLSSFKFKEYTRCHQD